MVKSIRNLVFEGGGVLGIAYLGVLDYLTRIFFEAPIWILLVYVLSAAN